MWPPPLQLPAILPAIEPEAWLSEAKFREQDEASCPTKCSTEDTFVFGPDGIFDSGSGRSAPSSGGTFREASTIASSEVPPCLRFPATPESTPCNSPRRCDPDLGATSELVSFEADCEALLRQLGQGECTASRQAATEFVTKAVWSLSTSPSGSRLVQRILDVASEAQQLAVASQLRGQVLAATRCPHAHHVLQKCIGTCALHRLPFILDELGGHVAAVARHRFGCRVLERLLERTWQTELLVHEIVSEAAALSVHPFGNFVVQAVLRFGTAAQRHSMFDILLADAHRLARHRIASNVMRCALVQGSFEDKERLVLSLTCNAKTLADLKRSSCGSHVVKLLPPRQV